MKHLHFISLFFLTLFVSGNISHAQGALSGKWTDGSYVYSFSNFTVHVLQNGKTLASAKYFYDNDLEVYMVEDIWDDGGEYPVAFAPMEKHYSYFIEPSGGSPIYKVINDNPNLDPFDMLTKSSAPCTESIDWVYTKWHSLDEGTVIEITPDYIICGNEKTPYKARKIDHVTLGTVIQLGEYFLDTKYQMVYKVSDLDCKEYFDRMGANGIFSVDGFDWVLGTWKTDYCGTKTVLNIKWGYLQYAEPWGEDSVDTATAKKITYTIKFTCSENFGDVLTLCAVDESDRDFSEYYIDDENKELFFVCDWAFIETLYK